MGTQPDMKIERPLGPNLGLTLALLDRARRPAEADGKRFAPAELLADAETFEQEFSRVSADDDESSNDDEDEKPRATPFELLRTPPLPFAPAAQAAVHQGIPQILLETVQQLYVEDGKSSNRQVSVTLAEDVLPGVTLSVFEDGGRVVAEFTCAVEQSRECLCQCAERLASDLANRLQRETRICVRADDPEDPCAAQVEATPTRDAMPIKDADINDVGIVSLDDMQDRNHDA